MKKDFILRSLKISTIVAFVFAPFLILYFGPPFAFGFVAGALWNIANIFLLSQLLTMALMPATLNKRRGAVAGIVKFPVLYGIGYVLIKYTNISLYGIIFGFSLVLTVFMLRALGVYYTDIFCQGTRSYGRGA